MIIATEKYKDTYIVYIDENIENIEDLPTDVCFERLSVACENLSGAIQMLMNTIEPEQVYDE